MKAVSLEYFGLCHLEGKKQHKTWKPLNFQRQDHSKSCWEIRTRIQI
jgi:hypothetical protein